MAEVIEKSERAWIEEALRKKQAEVERLKAELKTLDSKTTEE